MGAWHRGLLSGAQAAAVGATLADPVLVRDLSWGQVDTVVMEVQASGGRYVVKAGGLANHHLGREISAHETATGPLVEIGRAPRMVHADRGANVLVTEYLEGALVEGTAGEWEVSTYVQAGMLLRRLHGQASRPDAAAERRATERSLDWLDRPHRIRPAAAREARALLEAYEPDVVTVVPTHGDWQPRNWLSSGGVVSVIDFGRFAFRTAASDLCRLAAQQWREDPALERAFFEGYGTDPRDTVVWPMLMLREAIATSAWSYEVGDERFEAQGHAMLDEALAAF